MAKTQPKPPVDPSNNDPAPDKLPDPRSTTEKVKDKASAAMDRLAESEAVDAVTNAAAETLRKHGDKNVQNLAKKFDDFFDKYVAENAPGILRPILKRLPIAKLVGSQIDRLVDMIADWLEDFSDASEDDDATTDG